MEAVINRRNAIFVITTLIGVLLDQLTKWWIVANVPYRTGEIKVIDGFFSIVHAQNPGAAFGALGGYGNRFVVFGIFTVVALFVVADMFRKLPRNEWFMSMTLGLILSGAIGNAIDRVRQQYVTDFIRIYTEHPTLQEFLRSNFGTYEWPSFNVADMALVIGVAFFILHYIFVERPQNKAKAAAEAAAQADSEPAE